MTLPWKVLAGGGLQVCAPPQVPFCPKFWTTDSIVVDNGLTGVCSHLTP